MKFQPKKGQIDYTNVHWCPVMNCVVMHKDKILIVQRSSAVGFYPEYWNGISGFLDDDRSLEMKVREEIEEELGIDSQKIESIELGEIFHQKSEQYNKTWIVHPVLVEVSTDEVKTDWEAQGYRWISMKEVYDYKLLPGFDKVIKGIKKIIKNK
ncbi:NUDIX domain-containing protein [Patescibacteria group bacterium]